MSGRTGRRSPCTLADARARLRDAEAFLETAEMVENADVKATNAIHAAIAAADAICCVTLAERSADGNHAAAIALLSRVDGRLANALGRALGRRAQASYESRDISATDAESCVRQARALAAAARVRATAT
jgi:hypothetical protein